MAFPFFFNMEALALEIAREHIDNMTENNYVCLEDGIRNVDERILCNNIKNGFVAITQLRCYVESFLNTIIDRCRGYDDSLMRKSDEDKMVVLFLERKEVLKAIKSNHPYEEYVKARKVRNEMMHFKKAFIGEGTLFPDFILAKINVSDYFTQSRMKEVYEYHVSLCEEIATALGLRIYSDIDVFEVAARDGLTSYVYDPLTTEVDESRFK